MVVILSSCLPAYRCVKTIIVATHISAKKSAYAGTRGLQQFGERTKAFASQVSQLLAVALLHRLIETSQELETLRHDPCHHHSAVFGFAAPRNQGALFQAVE